LVRYDFPRRSEAIASLGKLSARERRRRRRRKTRTTGRLERFGGSGSGCIGKMGLEGDTILIIDERWMIFGKREMEPARVDLGCGSAK